MRRRSKPKVVWLPTTNSFSVDADGDPPRSAWQFASAVITDDNITGAVTTFEIPVIQDGALSGPLEPTSTLSDIENSGYRLRRIVGKVFVFIAQVGVNSASLFGVTAGFIIRRTDPGTGGSLAAAIGPEEINPADIENSMDPWIWRRSWILGNNSGSTNNAQTQNFGNGFQTALDGPHVDQKTARVVGPEERLVLDISATTLIPGPIEEGPSLIVVTDLRVLASMRVSVGNRRNASR